MKPVTRRSFIAAGSAGALGVAGAAALGSPITSMASGDEPELTESEAAAVGPAALSIRNARTGQVELLVGNRSIKFTDKQLVRRVARASR
jgi:hypothetical protein